MITYPITMPPLPGFVDFAWEPESKVALQENEFDYSQTIYKWEGQRRKASVEVGIMTLAQAKRWQSWALSLNGIEGTFDLQDPVGAEHRGALDLNIAQTPRVNGGGQNGMDLITDGWQVSTADLLLAGDYIGIRGRLHQLIVDVSSDAGGNATLSIWPHADFTMLDNDQIFVGVNAFGIFRLLEFPRFPYDVEHMTKGFAFGCVEAF